MYAYLLSILFHHKNVLCGFFQNFGFTFNLETQLRLLYKVAAIVSLNMKCGSGYKLGGIKVIKVKLFLVAQKLIKLIIVKKQDTVPVDFKLDNFMLREKMRISGFCADFHKAFEATFVLLVEKKFVQKPFLR